MAAKKKKTVRKNPAAKAATSKRRPNGKTTIGFAVTPSERRAISAQAEKLAGGNLSAFLRHAATTCKTRAKNNEA